MTIRIGTASWTDPSLIKCKRFYPKGCSSAEQRLRYYASQFSLVEVDSTYYSMPRADFAQAWADRTPADFRFNVKAFRILTGHQTPPAQLPADVRQMLEPIQAKNVYYKDLTPEIRDMLWRRYLGGIEPLRVAGKLMAVHFQFAPWFTHGSANMDYLREVRERLNDYTVSIEFRSKGWLFEAHRESTLELLRQNRLVHTITDEPQGFPNSVEQVWEVTNPELSVLRLHGRNVETWAAKDAKTAADRFNYDYSDIELAGLAEHARRIVPRVRDLSIVFNNNNEDQGQRNARTLRSILEGKVEQS